MKTTGDRSSVFENDLSDISDITSEEYTSSEEDEVEMVPDRSNVLNAGGTGDRHMKSVYDKKEQVFRLFPASIGAKKIEKGSYEGVSVEEEVKE